MIRDALLTRWLVVLAWRQRNLRECKLLPYAEGGNLFKEEIPTHSTMAQAPWVQNALKTNPHQKVWHFCFRPEETKNGKLVRAILPHQLVDPLESYVEHYRPLLANGQDSHTLFVNDHGGRFNSTMLQSRVGRITARYVGWPINPHLFRHICAVTWLKEHPKDYLTLSKILWHKNVQTTIGIDGRNVDESEGARCVEERLDERKDDE
jgi:integrase